MVMGASFSDPIRQVVDCGRIDFGAASGPYYKRVAGPSGKRGKIREIIFACEEAANFSTNDAKVEVGDGSDADEYASMTFDNVSALEKFIGADGYGDDPDAIIADIPESEETVVVTMTEGTGTSLTGIGNVYIIIDWF